MRDLQRRSADADRRHLGIDLGMKVMIQLDGEERRRRGQLVGGEGEDYLLVRLLDLDNLEAAPAPNCPVMGGCVHLGTVFAFETRLLQFVREPVPVLFLAYPERVQHHELRGRARISSDLPARVRIGDRELRGRVVDLSSGGCRFSVRAASEGIAVRPATGTPVELSFLLFGGFGEQVVRGVLRSVESSGEHLEAGIQFDHSDPALQEKLESYVRSVLDFDRGAAA